MGSTKSSLKLVKGRPILAKFQDVSFQFNTFIPADARVISRRNFIERNAL